MNRKDQLSNALSKARELFSQEDLNVIFSRELIKSCENCKWYEVRNDSITCRWCERYPRMPFKDYWESTEWV